MLEITAYFDRRLRPQAFLQLPDEDLAALIAVGPMVFKVGTADVLGQMRLGNDRLIIELAHIEGGGEGVLFTLSRLAESFARQRGIGAIEWIVHAVNCAKPNVKLGRVLERRGFVVNDVPGYRPSLLFPPRGSRFPGAR